MTYTLSRNQTVIVQYVSDDKTDLFQIGRSSEPAIDFIVLDTVVPTSPSIGHSNQQQQQQQNLSSSTSSTGTVPTVQQQSTISRFSCRICVDRQYPHTARIYAAGFDSSKRIFLGVIFIAFSYIELV